MHPSAYLHVEAKVAKYLATAPELRVVDLGSQDVNGSYRPLFAREGWSYVGVDLAPGDNVDVLLRDPYRLPFRSNSVDALVSGSTFEHVEFFWLTWLEVVRVVKPGGHIILVVPSRGPEHRYPADYWRFYPDSMKALARFGGVELLEHHTDWEDNGEGGNAIWGDTVGVFRVRTRARARAWLQSVMLRLVSRWLAVSGR